jgi:hypothetical protein
VQGKREKWAEDATLAGAPDEKMIARVLMLALLQVKVSNQDDAHDAALTKKMLLVRTATAVLTCLVRVLTLS